MSSRSRGSILSTQSTTGCYITDSDVPPCVLSFLYIRANAFAETDTIRTCMDSSSAYHDHVHVTRGDAGGGYLVRRQCESRGRRYGSGRADGAVVFRGRRRTRSRELSTTHGPRAATKAHRRSGEFRPPPRGRAGHARPGHRRWRPWAQHETRRDGDSRMTRRARGEAAARGAQGIRPDARVERTRTSSRARLDERLRWLLPGDPLIEREGRGTRWWRSGGGIVPGVGGRRQRGPRAGAILAFTCRHPI